MQKKRNILMDKSLELLVRELRLWLSVKAKAVSQRTDYYPVKRGVVLLRGYISENQGSQRSTSLFSSPVISHDFNKSLIFFILIVFMI